jgi:hypothetical protein
MQPLPHAALTGETTGSRAQADKPIKNTDIQNAKKKQNSITYDTLNDGNHKLAEYNM